MRTRDRVRSLLAAKFHLADLDSLRSPQSSVLHELHLFTELNYAGHTAGNES
jgi:hypothetical protein